MPTYLFAYRTAVDYVPGDPDVTNEWRRFFEGIGARVEDMGNPVFSREAVGSTGAGTVLGGYSMIRADSLQEAVSLAAGCPMIGRGGGVEVGEITPLSTMPVQSTQVSAVSAA